ncbi:hypothetical protein Pla110_36860 [Polystyrenella longa]|uniref:DUF1614 domain-containing protein n=1 Tax=Polystyrenella longa TaxID=2528007 RepID=A0A518CRV6_9PLAN|nr:DUF1614 domain-containing protein [Polystyrenella longa]QDU81934.1 hypothetical protein Pla110_36860 [Polystyrenella longa]
MSRPTDPDPRSPFRFTLPSGEKIPDWQIRQFQFSGCLILFLLLFAGCLLPLFLIDVAQQALINLNLSPTGAILVLLGIIIGSTINVHISRRLTGRTIDVSPPTPFAQWPPAFSGKRLNEELIIAVNVGGCVIPALLGVWLLRPLLEQGGKVVMVLLIGILLNSVICYLASRPIRGLGILLPLWVPALIALLVPWIGLNHPIYESFRPATAYLIGISGPLLGADLLRWKDFHQIGSGMVSIGGSGTWDGILLAGLVGAFFA